jgi:hypothetical protein
MDLSVSVESATDAPLAEGSFVTERPQAGARRQPGTVVPGSRRQPADPVPLAPDHPRTGPHPTD